VRFGQPLEINTGRHYTKMMKRQEVNGMILDQVEDIDDDQRRDFINWILRFERKNMDKKQPHFKGDFKQELNKYDLSEYDSS